LLIVQALLFFLQILSWLILIRVIISFFPLQRVEDPWRKLLRMLYEVTEPILGPIRNLLPQNQMGVDFSPLIALFAIMLIRRLLWFLIG